FNHRRSAQRHRAHRRPATTQSVRDGSARTETTRTAGDVVTDQPTDPIATLVKLSAEGRDLDGESNSVSADSDFDFWVHRVSEHLQKHFGPEIALEWQSLADSPLVYGGHYYDDDKSWLI